MREEWRNITGCKGLYQINNNGKVRSLNYKRTGLIKELKPIKFGKRRQYLKVDLYINGKRCSRSIHRLVAEAFLPNPKSLPEVNHKDENTFNNTVFIDDNGLINESKSNLEWCDRLYNCKYNNLVEKLSKKKSKRVYQYDLNDKLIKIWNSAKEAGRNGFSQSIVSRCCNGGYFDKKRGKWINISKYNGYIWSYKPLK